MSALLAVLLGVIGFVAALLLYEGALAARQLYRDDGRLRLKEVARARGLVFRPARTHAAMNAQALAVRRCVACRRRSRCDRLAAARDWVGLGEICPNSAYLESLRAG